MQGRLFPVAEGWYEWRQTPPLAETVMVRVCVADGGRVTLAGLLIDGEPSAGLLRAIPVGRIEAAANAQVASAGRVTVAHAPAVNPRRRPVQPPVADGAGWETIDPTLALHRTVPAERVRSRGRPDAFYQNIADRYRALAVTSVRPAADIAVTHGVPASTAHRWVKEARRRGLLPPGHPGRSG